VKYVVLEGASSIGKTLGVKLMAPTLAQEAYAFVDNVRLDWSYATIAYDPNPADGAELITKNPTLTWKPGVWADQHEVYFGTDETAVSNADNTDTTSIYKGTQDPCDYTPSGPLVLGETYYWKITEVNTGYVGPLTPPWEGDVWSFRVEGHAYDPSPADRERDVVFLGLDLEWTAGAEAENHVVYLGTDETAVANADSTDTTGIYQTTLTIGTESYSVAGQLTAGETYYWRIDEKKTTAPSHLIAGDVWSFTAGTFLVVDDFEDYANESQMYVVWDDYWVNGSDGELYVETDVNWIRESGSQAAQLKFENNTKDGGTVRGSWFDVQDLSELDIGSDWSTGGVKALFLYMRGDPCNAQVVPQSKTGPIWYAAQPWIELEDTSSNTGYVVHPQPELAGMDSWFSWEIDLGIFDACGVTLTAIDRFTIGIGGGTKTDQTNKMTEGPGFIYVDDIRLYPAQCKPDMGPVGDFTGDCNVDGKDLDVIGTDWLLQDGETLTENRPATLTGFPDETSHWVTGYIGTGAIEVNEGWHIDVTDPRLNGLASMSITAWIKPVVGMEKWVGVVCSRESVGCGDDASEIGVYGKAYGGPDGLGYDWSCGTEEWKWDAGVDITDGVWTFKKEASGDLQTGIRNVEAHATQQNFSQGFYIGRSKKGGGGPFVGAIDDVRIYAYDLDYSDVNDLAYQTAEPSPAPIYWYKFDETTGYTAADSGTPAYVYGPVPSPANLTDPEAKLYRFVNFADYAIFADNWMEQQLWPPW
jgi:hypothetical protein